ncbi:glycosyltransferase [Nonomuraea endophytica]|uniref:Galactofuranosylgalactofuranosylrhamnosyl-N-acetylglucosaminyl-diphospho-decaprenol beta-1,5/1,6-galactofuranosyltransferase n=1 Tax=Nonomuraea endophytica TaxID=714136 RepID=A0A7W8A455_9ACTN|nr:glycosyltransferase [Nonomuraea endophytica]MBB5078411.1 galactofuranosylgalactofuranosylrhamnosyl-N-acetylglucosaminyl-diphospho-decaprenol beta-1,5/1,6-galactofuranosyltransferase [Nonomuraea endophytica]
MTRTIQRVLFRGPSEIVSQDLYAVVTHGPVSRSRTGLVLGPSAKVSCDTYFGRLPASYWQRWTTAREVSLHARATGTGRLALAASDVNGFARLVTARDVTTGEVTLTARLDRFTDGGSLWLEAETEPGQDLTLTDVRWSTDAPAAGRRTAAVICTMDRPGDCLATLRALAADPAALGALAAIYVVDHGTRRVDAQVGFKQVEADLGGRLRHLAQPNLGGAGGFTRGLYELAPEPVNALLMDDDVLLEPDLVVRITAFAARATHPLITGGQMINLHHPAILLADAQQTDLDGIQPGVPMPHSRTDVNLLTGPLQERRLDAGYNGWWACLIPPEVVAAIGYPLPVFFQGDDAEYSYRARAHGLPTITLPGAGLWHTDFAMKDLDELNRYFLLRNYTIISALHGTFDLPRLLGKLAAELARHLLSMRYGLAETLLLAVEDFLTGPDCLRDGGPEALRKVRAARSGHPETITHPAAAPPGVATGELAVFAAGRRPLLAAPRRALDQLLGRHRHPLGAIAHDEAHWWHVALFETAVVTDASQRGVRVLRYDRRRLLTLARRGLAVLLRLAKEGRAVRERYRAALPELSSRENWRRLFGLDG